MNRIKLNLSDKILILTAVMLPLFLFIRAKQTFNGLRPITHEMKRGVEIGEGRQIIESCPGQYSHLVVDYPEVQLDPHHANIVHVESYENVSHLYKVEIRNDTVFVSHPDDNSPRAVPKIGYSALTVAVGSQSLKSIELRGGSIKNEVRVIGSRKNGEPVFHKADFDKFLMKFDSLNIDIYGGQGLTMLMDADYLNLNIHRGASFTSASFTSASFTSGLNYKMYGNLGEFNLSIDDYSRVQIDAEYLKTRKTKINNSEQRLENLFGEVHVNASDTLEAHLYGHLDVIYNDIPKTIIKTETNKGRLIRVFQ